MKTKIEWCDYSLNPIKGLCLHNCPYCYAIKMHKRFKWNPDIRLDLSVFEECKLMKAGSKVFVCSTHDLFGLWIPHGWQEAILELCAEYPKLTFIILTKAPFNLWKHHYPDNIWLGVSVENQFWIVRIKELLKPEVGAKTKFVSFEPLQDKIDCNFVNYDTVHKISWFIVGAETGNRKEKVVVKKEWVEHLLMMHASTPVFLKNNLGKTKEDFGNREEFPEGK